ncbi:pyrokinin-1 receptor-like [Harmonia axyridis]|uniref:pyrokinin-1 receptor-like n=1 Tax=Harmonia axyridis TaxID=115357 RepID=UPI001E278198|nr:pyrokinin-1 receptor-like [Harmonia axyridis]XP_045482188.1 pyrokinin-1 receptor-like [Harmonia axyridis]
MGDQNASVMECLEANLGPQRGSLYIVVPVIVIYSVIFLTGVVGNISTCIVISRNKSMHTATNYYLFSLAVSDLLLLLFGLPQEVYLIWSRYPYIFGATFCFLRGLFAEISSNATVSIITAFTVERYLAICHPLRSHMMSKLSRAVRIIFGIWFFSVFLAVPQAMQFGIVDHGNCEVCQLIEPMIEHSFEVSSLVFFIAPMTVISVLYILIGLKLHQSKIMRRKNVSITGHRNSSRKIIKMLVAVVVAFFICWAPFHFQRLFTIYSGDLSNEETYNLHLKIYEVVTYVSGILYYLSATINPILYNIMSVKFREAFKETFSRCCHLSCFKSRRPQRSYIVLSRSVPIRGEQASGSASSSGGKGPSVEIKDEPTSQTSTSLSRRGLSKSSSDQSFGIRSKPITFKEKRSRQLSVDTLESPEAKSPSTYEMKTCVRSMEMMSKEQSNVSECCGLFLNKNKENHKVQRRYSAHYTPAFLEEIAFRNSKNAEADSPCHISNSSLRDVERDVLEDELTAYMKEIQRREQTLYGVNR